MAGLARMEKLIRNITILVLFFSILSDLLAFWGFLLEERQERQDRQEEQAKKAEEKSQQEKYNQLAERLSQLEHQLNELEKSPDSSR